MLGITLFACEYEPEGIFQAKVPEPELVYFSIDLNIPPDTIFLQGAQEFRYTLNLSGKSLQQLTITFFGEEITYFFSDDSQTQGSFYLNGDMYQTGTYQLSFVLQTDTKSGSFADKLGAESYLVNITIPVVIDNTPPPLPTIEDAALRLELYNKNVTLRWDRFISETFYRYALQARYDESPYFSTIAELDDPNQTSFVDTGYLGGKVAYRLSILAGTDIINSYDGKELIHDTPFNRELMFEVSGDTTVELRWHQPPYPQNLYEYAIICSNCDRYYGNVELSRTEIVQDTTFLIRDLPFSQEIKYNIVARSRGSYSAFYPYQEIMVRTGKPTIVAYNLEHKPKQAAYYGINEQRIIRIEENSLNKTAHSASIAQNPDFYNPSIYIISEDGSYIYTTKGNSISQLDPLSLQPIKMWNISNFLDSTEHVALVGASNTGLLLVKSYGIINGYIYLRSLSILDMELEKWLVDIPIESSDMDAILSPSGHYFTFNGKIYRLENDVMVEHGKVPTNQVYNLSLNWLNDEEDAFWLYENRRVTLYNVDQNRVEKSFELETDFGRFSLDPTNTYMTGITDLDGRAYFYWYSTENGALLKKIQVLMDGNSYGYANILWSTNGYYLPISFE